MSRGNTWIKATGIGVNPPYRQSLRIQKHCCKNPECDWQSTPTISSVFGTDIHPELAKLQCEQGALHSYREAASNLEKLNAQRRSANNHDRVKSMANRLGAQLVQENQKMPKKRSCLSRLRN